MNKQLIITLAVCLVCVHAFVKREAPAPTTEGTNSEGISRTVVDLFNSFKDTAAKAINPDEIKRHIDAVVKGTREMAQDVSTRVQTALNSNRNVTTSP